MIAQTEHKLTGYPSIDKPWLKYYSKETIDAEMPHCSMYEYIRHENENTQENIALNYFGNKITYRELFGRIERAAAAFKKAGVENGDVVTIMSMHIPETIECIYALNMIGAVSNLIYMTLSEEEIIAQITAVHSKIFLYLAEVEDKVYGIQDKLRGVTFIRMSSYDSMLYPIRIIGLGKKSYKFKRAVIRFKDFINTCKSTKVDIAEYEENKDAIIVYSSGTTGNPKGVVHTNDSMNAVAFQYKIAGMGIEKGSTFLNPIPPFFGFGISIGIHTQLSLGTTGILHIVPETNLVSRTIRRMKPNHVVLGPAFLDAMLDSITGDMRWLQTLAGGGGGITEEQERRLNNKLHEHKSKLNYLTGYGMTEFGATVCTNMNRCQKFDSLGIPFPKTNIKIIDTETHEELPYGKTGEMCFCTPNRMKNYLNNPEQTVKTMEIRDGMCWVHTGDLGHVDRDGFVYFDGRIKRIYITKAADGTVYKLFPERIENVISVCQDVQQVAVVVEEDKAKLNIAVAYVVLKKGNTEKQLAFIRDTLVQKLPDYSVPKTVMVIESMPLTQSGKIDYRKLQNCERDEKGHGI